MLHSKMLINEPPLMFTPSLAVAVGVNEAIFLQQVHYWLEKSKHVEDGFSWIYNTHDDWHRQFPFWSVSTIRRTIGSLEKKGLIVTGNYNKLGIDQTKWYRIDYNALNRLNSPSVQNEQMGNGPSVQNEQTSCSNWTDQSFKMDRPLPEITSENLTTTTKPEKPLMMYFEEELMVRMSPTQMHTLFDWRDDFGGDQNGDEVIRYAIKIAADKNKRSFAFVEFLLRDWMNNKAQTVAAIQSYEKEKFGKKTGVPVGGKPRIDFDSFRDDE